jgi:two-component system, OmpR family, phosphate regulon sensor histidine kinase PhoR
MSSSKVHLRLTCIALTISLSLAADWIAGPWFNIDSSAVRWGLFVLNLALTTASLVYLLGQVWATQNAAMRELELLCGADIRELDAAATFSSLPEGNSWVEVLTRVRQRLVAVGGRLQELEQDRAALESRSRRNEDHARRMNSILSGLTEPVIAIDKYDELVLTNPSAEELFSIDPTNTEARALSHLVHCEKLVDLLTETRKRKVPSQRTCEVELSDARGLARWYRVTARSIPPQAGQTEGDSGSQGVVAVLHDISSQKTIQKRNAEFVSAVSHEMKTPLAGIKAYVELLVDGDAEDVKTQEEFLEIINAQADRLQRLVDNMLNLARIEAGVVGVDKQSRSLNELLEEALQVIQPAAEAKGITLKSDLSPLYLPVLVDRDMALQSAINLLSNAVKYTPPAGQVTLRSRLAGNEVRFDVEDNGVGLSAEDCQKVFEKFYRVQKDKEMAAGTGLGLPLVKHIVEDVHGGKIAVQSTLGKGSVFSVFLPSAGHIT